MTITFGIYDFFSYTIPGVVYILAVNHLLAVLGLRHLGAEQMSVTFAAAFLAVILAYALGQVMDSLGIRWYTLFNKFGAETGAMHDFRKKNADLGIEFGLDDRRMLFAVIRSRNLALAQVLDSYKAVSIMLQNLSLALFLFALIEVLAILLHGFGWGHVAGIVVAAVLSYVAVKRSQLFNKWHWLGVFEQARQYGKSLPEMLGSEPAGDPSQQ